MLISVPARYQGADGALLRVKALAGIALKPSLCLIALASVPSPVFSRHLLKPAGMRSPHRACVLIIWLCFHMCRMSFSIASLSISVCPYSNKMSPLKATIGFFFFLIHSTTLCLLIGGFSTCTFKLLKGMFLLPFCSLFSGYFIVLLYLFQG